MPIDVPGLVSATDLHATVDGIAEWQLPSGMVPWFPGGHADPWNHVEAAMALDLGGRHAEADRAYEWLVGLQRDDGSWHQYYIAGDDGSTQVEQDKLDANVCAYIAAGVWHRWLLTDDRGFVEEMWPVVEKAIDFVLDLQTPRGEILWARHADGTPWSFALLTGSSSICHSLRCAIGIAELLGHERPDWELSAARADTFIMDGRGVRCVSDRPWITVAETCECAMAYLAVGDRGMAEQLFGWAQQFRHDDDGRYWTGTVFPDEAHFPGGERSTYTAASVILTADALAGSTPASALFVETPGVLPPLMQL